MIPTDLYWDHEEGVLRGMWRDKVRAFLREGLIQEAGDEVFLVAPSVGRHLVHTVRVAENSCTCQRSKIGYPDCSHRAAVFMFQNHYRKDTVVNI